MLRKLRPGKQPDERAGADGCAGLLESCFDGSGDIALPLADTADGTTYQYATVAALALRYYGIPARYVEGYTVKPLRMNRQA